MNHIITLTLNPSIDKSTSIETLLPEVKLSCSNPIFQPGGGGINVSRALSHFDTDSLAIYFAGGENGAFFTQLLDKEQIKTCIIPINDKTRENLVVLDKTSQKQYRFGMPSPAIQLRECEECITTIENLKNYTYFIASGSLPNGIPSNFLARIATIVASRKAKFIVDTSGEALKQALDCGVFMIKPNLKELSLLSGKELKDDSEILLAAQAIISKKKCEVVVVSLGKEGAMLVSADKHYTLKPPKVVVKSTVGAGDSMVAGMVYALTKNLDWNAVLAYGIAAGSAATMNDGTELCKKADTERLFQLIQ